MALPDKERIQRIKPIAWINYPRAKAILAKLEDLLEAPKSPRPDNLLLVGDSNSGKSAIAFHFLEKHPEIPAPDKDAKHIPVVYIECPEKPEEKRLYDLLISKVGGVIPDTASISAIQRSLCETYDKIGVRLIIIDEIHNALRGGPSQQEAFLTLIKGISNRTQTPIVTIGIQTAFRLMVTDDQISNRFDPVPLPKWDMSEDYLRLMASFEQRLPLKEPSVLTQLDLANVILAETNGLLGEMFKLLAKATAEAIRNKSEKITIDLIRSIGWVAPGARNKSPL